MRTLETTSERANKQAEQCHSLDIALVERALRRLTEILDAETELLVKYTHSSGNIDITQFNEEKCDLINFLEWQQDSIIKYITDHSNVRDVSLNDAINAGYKDAHVEVEVSQGNANTDNDELMPSSMSSGGWSADTFADVRTNASVIKVLLREMYAALNKNLEQVTRKKFVNEQIVSTISEAVCKADGQLNCYTSKGSVQCGDVGFKPPFFLFNKNT